MQDFFPYFSPLIWSRNSKHRRKLEPRQFLILEANLTTRRGLLQKVEATYLMTVTHFPLSLDW